MNQHCSAEEDINIMLKKKVMLSQVALALCWSGCAQQRARGSAHKEENQEWRKLTSLRDPRLTAAYGHLRLPCRSSCHCSQDKINSNLL